MAQHNSQDVRRMVETAYNNLPSTGECPTLSTNQRTAYNTLLSDINYFLCSFAVKTPRKPLPVKRKSGGNK